MRHRAICRDRWNLEILKEVREVRNTAARRRPPPAPAPEAVSTGVHPKLRTEAPCILLVDDAEDNRALYAEYFAHQHWRVVQAVDGEHALLKVASLMPDVVVMDLAMPVVDGWEATRNIKAHPRTKHIPVICITGHASAENLERARDAGADAVLVKPCPPMTVFEIATQLLGGEAVK